MTWAPPTLESPTASTNAGYAINRLADPTLTISCAGTVLYTVDFTVSAVTAAVEGGALDTVTVPPGLGTTSNNSTTTAALSAMAGWRVLLYGDTSGGDLLDTSGNWRVQTTTSGGSLYGSWFDDNGHGYHPILAVTALPGSFTGYADGIFFAITT